MKLGAKRVSRTQEKILGLIVDGMSSDDIIFSLWGGENEPEFASDCVRTHVYALRNRGFGITNKPNRIHCGSTGYGTKAVYKLLSIPDEYKDAYGELDVNLKTA